MKQAVARAFLGVLSITAALFLLLGSILAISDPVGTKYADDGDPFGPPDPWYYSVPQLIAGGGLMYVGVRLLSKTTKASN